MDLCPISNCTCSQVYTVHNEPTGKGMTEEMPDNALIPALSSATPNYPKQPWPDYFKTNIPTTPILRLVKIDHPVCLPNSVLMVVMLSRIQGESSAGCTLVSRCVLSLSRLCAAR
jgi:hypothetical protein